MFKKPTQISVPVVPDCLLHVAGTLSSNPIGDFDALHLHLSKAVGKPTDSG